MPRLLLAAAAVTTALALAPPAGAATFGSPGLGDPFFPLAGNGGYDVRHYALTLDYTRATQPLQGSATISATRDAGARPLRSRPARLRDLAP